MFIIIHYLFAIFARVFVGVFMRKKRGERNFTSIQTTAKRNIKTIEI